MHACLLRIEPDFAIYEAFYRTAPGVSGAHRKEIIGTEVLETRALELKQDFITVDGKQVIVHWAKALKSILPVMIQSLPAAAVPYLIARFAGNRNFRRPRFKCFMAFKTGFERCPRSGRRQASRLAMCFGGNPSTSRRALGHSARGKSFHDCLGAHGFPSGP